MDDGVEDLLREDMTKQSLARLLKQNTKRSSSSAHFRTGVRFSSW